MKQYGEPLFIYKDEVTGHMMVGWNGDNFSMEQKERMMHRMVACTNALEGYSNEDLASLQKHT